MYSVKAKKNKKKCIERIARISFGSTFVVRFCVLLCMASMWHFPREHRFFYLQHQMMKKTEHHVGFLILCCASLWKRYGKKTDLKMYCYYQIDLCDRPDGHKSATRDTQINWVIFPFDCRICRICKRSIALHNFPLIQKSQIRWRCTNFPFLFQRVHRTSETKTGPNNWNLIIGQRYCCSSSRFLLHFFVEQISCCTISGTH